MFNLLQKQLEIGKQVLYLLPEIALTTQLVQRFQDYFGDKVAVFHRDIQETNVLKFGKIC